MKQLKYFILLSLILFNLVGCSNREQAKKIIPNRVSPNHVKPINPKDKIKNEIQLNEKKHWSTDLIATYTATLPNPILYERHNIELASKYLDGALVKPGQIFSLNDRIGRRSYDRGFKLGPTYHNYKVSNTVGGGVCKVASVLYNVSVLSNQKIIERHPHSMTVPYVPLGQDATISYGTMDFKFQNISKYPIRIKAFSQGGSLTISFYGKYKPPKVKWEHRVKKDGSIIIVNTMICIDQETRKRNINMGLSQYKPEKH